MRNSGSRIFTKSIGFSDFNSFVFDIPRGTVPAKTSSSSFFVGDQKSCILTHTLSKFTRNFPK